MINFYCIFFVLTAFHVHYNYAIENDAVYSTDLDEIKSEKPRSQFDEIKRKPLYTETLTLAPHPMVTFRPTSTTTRNFSERKNSCVFSKEISCYDCQTLEYCTGQWLDGIFQGYPIHINCANQTDNARPYCDRQTNRCVAENTCSKKQTRIQSNKLDICQADGSQPDPLDCKRYIHCYRQADGSYDQKIMTCPLDAPVYDMKTYKCGFFPCVDMHSLCKVNAGKMIAFKALPQVYGKCPDDLDTNKEINLFVCPQNHTFSAETVSCEPTCEQEGLIPADYDCQSYYSCHKQFLTFSLGLHACPRGFEFSPSKLQCVISDTCHPNQPLNVHKR